LMSNNYHDSWRRCSCSSRVVTSTGWWYGKHSQPTRVGYVEA